MSAGGQDPQRGEREARHAGSVAQKLLRGLALTGACACAVVACGGDTDGPPIDPDDVDGDGIANAQDLCPSVHDPAQHDEDGDGVGDLCDVCPTVIDPQQADRGETDGIAFADGVGDACDPRPSAGGDKIGALHTFVADTAASWIGAGWTIAGDRARASEAARWLHRSAEQGDGLTARLAVEALAWTGAGGRLEVAVDGDGVESGRTCALVEDRNADGRDELEVREIGGAAETREVDRAVTGEIVLIVQRGVERRTGTGTIHCRLHFLDEAGHLDEEITVTAATLDDATTGQYVFAAEGAEVTATSLVVYTAPIGCVNTARAACPGPPPP